MTDFEQISRQAEADLNTYEAKTGHRHNGLAEAGVDSSVEKKFPSAQVLTGDELSTNAGYNKRIPPSEGGMLEDRGRQTRGEHFDGNGGPIEKLKESYRRQPGQNDNDVVPAQVPKVEGIGGINDIATKGQEATASNLTHKPSGVGGSQFKGENYYMPESVPDSISAEGNIPPSSVIEASRETERY